MCGVSPADPPSHIHTHKQDVIENQIYPPLSNGFSDEIPYIRELTLKSILTLAPKMKQGTLTSNLLKHLSRLQVGKKGGSVWAKRTAHPSAAAAAGRLDDSAAFEPQAWPGQGLQN